VRIRHRLGHHRLQAIIETQFSKPSAVLVPLHCWQRFARDRWWGLTIPFWDEKGRRVLDPAPPFFRDGCRPVRPWSPDRSATASRPRPGCRRPH
jgi:hypothetical protein